MKQERRSIGYTWGIFTCLFVYFILNGYASQQLGVTGDEMNYYEYGVQIWKGHPEKPIRGGVPVFNSHMPVTAVYVIPRVIEQLRHPGARHTLAQTQRDIRHSRWISVFIGCLIGWLIARWASDWAGARAGFLAVLGYVLCPNMLAHTSLVSTDVFFYLFTLALVMSGWYFQRTHERKYLVAMAIALGFALISKPTAILLIPIALFLLFWRFRMSGYTVRQWLWPLVRQSVFLGLIGLVMINLAFLGQGFGKSLSDYSFLTEYWQSWQHIPVVNQIPLPCSEPFVQTFDFVRFNVETPPGMAGRSAYGQTSFLDKPIAGKWIWYYYPVVMALKWPMSFSLLLIVGVFVAFRFKQKALLGRGVYLWFPVLFLLIAFVGWNHMYLGIRSILMIMPFLFIGVGLALDQLLTRSKRWWWLIGLCWVIQVGEISRYFPHVLPYNNFLITNKHEVYRWFSDSNLYFQEGWPFAQAYLRAHPEVLYEPEGRVAGKVLVSVEAYVDFWHTGKLNWLRALKLRPIDSIHGQYLLFDVPPDATPAPPSTP